MDPQRYERLRRIFLLICDLPATEQVAAIKAQCPDDPAMCDEIGKLLEMDAQKTGLLESPTLTDQVQRNLAEALANEPATSMPTRIGRYEAAIGLLKRRLIRNPDTDISRVLLAASYGHLGREDEARAEWQAAFRVNPDYSLAHRRKVLPYKNPADFELIPDGLRKAGLVD